MKNKQVYIVSVTKLYNSEIRIIVNSHYYYTEHQRHILSFSASP